MVTFTDAVSINWDSSLWLFKDNSFSADLYGNTGNVNYNSITTPATAALGGIGWYLPLNGQYGEPFGSASFTLIPVDNNQPDGTQYNTSVTGVYAHRTLAWSALGFAKSGSAVNITGTYNQMAATTSFSHG